AYVVFAFADSVLVLFLSRLVQGAGGGTVSVIQAYVADATRPEDRAKSLGWLSAATNLGVAIGPVLGSLAHGLGPGAPWLGAAGLCIVNSGAADRFRVGSPTEEARRSGVRVGTSRETIARGGTPSGEPATRLIWIYTIAMGAF